MDAGDWINMTNNANGCENQAGTPCGWTATPNMLGYTCVCYNGNDAVPWGCEPPNSCVTPGPSCPSSSAPICTADAGPPDTGPPDTGPSGDASSVWIYMGTNANACDGNVGDPCGWTTTNLGQGYTCQTESWGTGCEPPP